MSKSKRSKAEVTRVAIYCRVSTEEQATEGFSIGTQTNLAQEWCEGNLDGKRYETEVFVDEGLGGKLGWEPPKRGPRKYRPELARLVQAIEAGDVDLVIVYRLDRLARPVRVIANFLEICVVDNSVGFVSLCEDIDYSRAEGRLLAHVLAAVADHQAAIISENVSNSLQNRKREGLPLGTHYGWRPVPPVSPGARPTIEPEPEQAFWIPKIYEWFLRGWGARRIAKELELQGAPLHPGAKRWARGSVNSIIQDPLNAGYIQIEDELIRGQHYDQRVIEKELFDAAQCELESRRREGPMRADGDLQPLYKVARCGLCGQPVKAVRVRVTEGVCAYRCRGSEWDHKETCSGWAKDTRLVDRVVLKQLAAFMDRAEFQELVAEEAREEVMARQVKGLEAEQARLERAVAQKTEEERRLLRIYSKGKVSEDIYYERYESIQQDNAELNAQLDSIKLQLGNESERMNLLAEVERAVTQLPKLWDELNPEERRHLLREVIEYCYVQPIGDRKHRVRVKFHYLPEVAEDLPNSKSRITGLLDDIAHVSDRELAYLTLRSDGWSDEQIYKHWEVTLQATYYLRKSAMKRLQVDSIEEAIRLARGRIEKERDQLPLGPTGWHPGRLKEKDLRPREEEALVRYIRGGDEDQIAQEMGLKVRSVEFMLYHVRKTLGCETLADAAEKYLEQKGGRLAGYGDQLAL